MRRVHRPSTPTSLLPGGAGDAELARLKLHRITPPPPRKKKKSFEYTAYKSEDVRRALEKVFHGKCAYCETYYAASAPVDIEHYRPKGGVSEDVTHGGYWWIAMQWENLLPSCIDCNRKRGQVIVEASTSLTVLATTASPKLRQAGKQNSFPLANSGVRAAAETNDFSREQPLLINPCNDDPAAHLMYSVDPSHPTGLIVPTGSLQQQKRGAVSIQVYGLNRLKLLEDRNRVLRALEFLGDLIIDVAKSIADLEAPDAQRQLLGTAAEGVAARLRLLRDRMLTELKAAASPEAPYASMASAWMEEFKQRLTR
ncbi:HNH endonuclease [Pseudomonas vranovensis]|uniref:HNH endonuclease n=1 Tax=Pseudomonas vranovensis TaxID=321661 RepID=A0A423DGP0_9PSED|nr:HNH endonuclease [Pseudomonas vranovensis]ROL70734.1 HNH endonuclease [Pseudomonas vranovensis]